MHANDVIALCDRVSHALDKIRTGNGPVLIEALTYRMGDHTTADDASRYRADVDVAIQQRYDPLQRLRQFLLNAGYWSEDREAQLHNDCAAKVDAAVKVYLDTPVQPPESMFDYLYAELPEALAEQREQLRRRTRDD